MLDFIRTHQRLMQLLLLLLIIPSFVFVGLEGYMNKGDDSVAKVAGQSISQRELDSSQREQMERFREMFGAQFDPKMFDTPEARQTILENLIAQRALSAEASRQHLTVTDQTLQRAILAIPDLKTPDGKFDGERYKALLAVQGITPEIYENRLRQDIALQQLNGAIQSTAFAPKTVATRLSDLNDQQRQTQELAFKATDFVSQVKVTEEMLKDYYNKNGSRFEIPEQAKVEYVVLNLDAVAAQTSVSDADIKSYYEQNKQRYSVDEQRRASHILINASKNASAADKAAAKEKAEKLLAQVRKNPGDFAALAKQHSEDSVSAERGGDLDFFGRGMMKKSFEDAAYLLKEGDISNLVETDFGYHIIKLTGIKPGSVQALEEVKNEIAAEIKKQQAAKKYAELAETFSNTVYEQADSLKPVADKLKLKIETASGVTREPNPAAAPTALYNNPKFLKVLFSDDTIKNKRNTEAVEVAPNTLVAGRIVEHKPSTKRPFSEVEAIVRERVMQTEALNLTKKAGDAKLAALKAKDDTTGFSEVKIVSRTKNPGLNGAAQAAVMKADVRKLPAFVGVELPGQGYGIYRIGKVETGTPEVARRQAEQQQIANALAQQEMAAYIDILKKKAKVQILRPVTSSTEPEQPARK